jgi:DNA-binding response OmpR family regulator
LAANLLLQVWAGLIDFHLTAEVQQNKGPDNKEDGYAMAANLNTLQERAEMMERVTILVITPFPEDHVFLSETLVAPDWHLIHAQDCAQSRQLARQHKISVVVCERVLPDGIWNDILEATHGMDTTPPLIVVSRHADECLWAEVLNLGGYDVLVKPFDAREVFRVTEMACRHARNQWAERPAAAPSATFMGQYPGA